MELLRRNRNFRLLFLATLGSLLGTWLATIALTVAVYDRTHSGIWVSALLIVVFLPTVLVGVAVGPLLDRLSRRELMIASDLLRAGVFVALPFVDSTIWIVALAAVSGLGNAVYRPAVNAGMPNLLEEDQLEKGNALFMTVENMAWAAGPLVGGIIVATSGTDVAYWINAVSFVVSALLIRMIAANRLQSEAALSRGHWRDLGDGFALARRSPAVQVVLAAWSVRCSAWLHQRRRGRDREGVVQRGRLRLRAPLRRVGGRSGDRQLHRRHARANAARSARCTALRSCSPGWATASPRSRRTSGWRRRLSSSPASGTAPRSLYNVLLDPARRAGRATAAARSRSR